MSQPKIKIGLIGAGAIMRLGHAPTIKASDCSELVGVFDTDLARAEQITGDFGGTAYDDLEAMLDRAAPEAVIVATPNRFHEEGVVAAARRGKHVLCEKPLALDTAAAKRMVNACHDARVILQIGFNQRFWQQVEVAKKLIDAGFIGKIHQIRSIYSEKAAAYPASTRYRYDLAQSGGATIIDLTIHRIDLARHLIGDFSGVFAELTHSELPEMVDDNVFLLARFASGARGSLAGNRYSPNIADGTDLYGTEGTIHIASETISPFASAPLAVYTEKPAADLPDVLREAHYPEAWWESFKGGWITVKPPRRSPYAKQFAAFCESIRQGEPARVTGLDGLRAQEVVQGAYLSMRSGGWVDLPLPDDAPFAIPDYQ
ncbi:MAG: Gfo/Idh/MocA family protein [Acetobacteraceae bacterium]